MEWTSAQASLKGCGRYGTNVFSLPAANLITLKPNQLSVLWEISGLPDKRQRKQELNQNNGPFLSNTRYQLVCVIHVWCDKIKRSSLSTTTWKQCVKPAVKSHFMMRLNTDSLKTASCFRDFPDLPSSKLWEIPKTVQHNVLNYSLDCVSLFTFTLWYLQCRVLYLDNNK